MTAHRTRIKICGLRDEAMARFAAEAGADAIGLVFHEASPRFVRATEAAAIVRGLPPFVASVGLFVNLPAAQVRALLAQVPLGLLQFHGDEDAAYCGQFGLPWMKAVRVGKGTDLVECAHQFPNAAALLLDAQVKGEYGGTGTTFDWTLVPRRLGLPVVLSGGLQAENVGEAIAATRPWAVDVSSGVEVERGVKDRRRIEAFVRSVRDADARFGG